MSDDTGFDALQDRLGYRFNNPALLEKALTHSSTGSERNYERLEFLGDRVVGLIMAQRLFEIFPDEKEGDLAKRHAALVQGKAMTLIARKLDLGDVIQLSDAERAAGGAENDNILADGVESVIGALYLDAGLDECRRVILDLWGDSIHVLEEPPQDPKTELQEWAQGRGLGLPVYELLNKSGPDHAPEFEIQAMVDGYAPSVALGASRRMAEKKAAEQLLIVLKQGD